MNYLRRIKKLYENLQDFYDDYFLEICILLSKM